MYVPELYRRSDREEILNLIRKYPFATVITWPDGAPFANHLPVFFEENSGLLITHLARANPQVRHFETSGKSGGEAMVIFNGPHAYISPRWYRGKEHVPTWNYATVHIQGKTRAVGKDRLLEILERSITEMEHGTDAYRFSKNPALPENFKDKLMNAIVGVEIQMDKTDAKFKLSQNRNPEDHAGVLEGLRGQDDDMSRAMLELMKNELTPDRKESL